jgi:phosphoribosylanthranilate isomerase
VNLKIKICGITNAEDALMAEKLGADAVGFILFKKSKRYISSESAAGIIKILSPFTVKVGVFVNEEPGEINRISSVIKLNAVQLHGDELPEDIDKIHLPVIKTFRINNGFDFSRIKFYQKARLLFDSYSDDDYGGTGKEFDWNKIPKKIIENIILAGGISSENITHIYQNIMPAAVDLSSSVEIKPGKKDHKKMEDFFNIINFVRKK